MTEESATGQATLASCLTVHRFSLLDEANVTHGVTSRSPHLPLYGNVSYMVGDEQDAVWHNRQMWGEAIGFDPARLVLCRQVHETTVAIVGEEHAGSGAGSVETSIRRVDALVTSTPGLPIGVVAADCAPILIHDPAAGVVSAIHAGWRGTIEGIVSRAVERLTSDFGSRPDDLQIGLGPTICQNCYQVGPEVIERWWANPSYRSGLAVYEDATGQYFDLRAANVAQLIDAGVSEGHIEVSPICTRCSNGSMFSRRGLGPRTGLFAAIIMLRDSNEGTSRERV